MTQCLEEIMQIQTGGAPMLSDWDAAKQILGNERVTLGPVASHSWLHQPEHLAFQLARYRAAAALIGNAESVLEIGCGEGIGAGILAKGRNWYMGVDADEAAVKVARGHLDAQQWKTMYFRVKDILGPPIGGSRYSASVALDVIEHIPSHCEDELMWAAKELLDPSGIFVIGTPSATFDHLASSQSRAGHINTYTHDRLRGLMSRYFKVVQMLGMQDTALHFGHPDARHYHLAVGIGPR
jgi:2-polyprenyl-3-methyl-5-hydroxy-6-metoxy-1,4-benzoquinol methylase